MGGVPEVLVIVAVVGLVLVRQFRPQRLTSDTKRWWVLPAVLAAVALRQSGQLLDPAHHTASAALLALQLAVGLAAGAAWAWTTRIWAEPDGSVWTRGRAVTAVVLVVGMGVRVALYGVTAAAGVRLGSGAALLGVAVTLLARSGGVVFRSRMLGAQSPTYRVPVGG